MVQQPRATQNWQTLRGLIGIFVCGDLMNEMIDRGLLSGLINLLFWNSIYDSFICIIT